MFPDCFRPTAETKYRVTRCVHGGVTVRTVPLPPPMTPLPPEIPFELNPTGAARPPVVRYRFAVPDRFLGRSLRPDATAFGLHLSAGWTVAVGLMLFGVVWLLHLNATALSAPVDNIEQLIWVRSLEWGYHKHPPVPTWLLWLPVRLLGLNAWTSYLLGATVTLTAMGVLWSLVRRLRGTAHANVALLATLCITYYSGRLNYYNHNVVLLLAAVASAACCWRAFEEKRLRWWLALGVVLGLGALSKYQIALTALTVVCFWITQRGWRERVHVRGLVLAAGVAVLVTLPHVAWLVAYDFAPIRYAMKMSLGINLGPAERVSSAVDWLVDQLLNRSLPAFILLALCMRRIARVPARPDAEATGPTSPLPMPPPDPARALLLCWAGVPLICVPALALVFGSELQLQWGTAFAPFVAAAAMELFRPRGGWSQVRMIYLLTCFVVVEGVLLTVNLVTSPAGIDAFKQHHWRSFPSAALADRIAGPARAKLGGPIRVVIGTTGIAGALALRLPERPLVLLDGDLRTSPWVGRDRVRDCGALELVSDPSARGDATPVGPDFPALHWRVIQPATGASRCV